MNGSAEYMAKLDYMDITVRSEYRTVSQLLQLTGRNLLGAGITLACLLYANPRISVRAPPRPYRRQNRASESAIP